MIAGDMTGLREKNRDKAAQDTAPGTAEQAAPVNRTDAFDFGPSTEVEVRELSDIDDSGDVVSSIFKAYDIRGIVGETLDADIARFEAHVSEAQRGAGGVITMPFFNGERTPNLPRAKACIVGLDSHNTRPENLLRSAVEGATFALRYGLDRLGDLGIEVQEILATGGGAGSATWRQVVADVCGAPVTVLRQDEGASFGAALQALSILDGGRGGDLTALTEQHLARNEGLCCEPDPSSARFYEETYQRYQEAVSAIRPLYS